MTGQPVISTADTKEVEKEPPSWYVRFFSLIYKDAKSIYRAYPTASKVFLLALLILIILVQSKPLLFLAVFFIIDRAVVFLQQKTDFKLRIEQVSLVSILFGYYYDITYGLMATLIMMSFLQYRNIKITFFGATLDGIIWILFVFLSAAMRSIDIGTVAFILPISRFVIKEIINVLLGFEIHDLHKDSMNMIYQIVFLRYLGPVIGAFMVG